MISQRLFNRFMDSLLEGKRQECRKVIQETMTTGADSIDLYHSMLWPAMEQLANMYREDQINIATEHMATRINRALADQLQANLEINSPNGKRILIACADDEPEELGAQMCADLFEAQGWEVYFMGGGVPNDEALSLVGQLQPTIFLIFGTQPNGVPGVRKLIDLIRDVGVSPTMNIMISGGVFNRAEGLWKEVNADLFAEDAKTALEIAAKAEPRKPVVRIPGAPKKRRRRRKPPLLAEAGV